MRAPVDPVLVKRLSIFASAASVFSAVVGVSALLGWFFHVEFLKTWAAGPSTVKVNTAICFILIGTSLSLLRGGDNHPFAPGKNLAAKIAALAAVIVGLLSAVEYTFNSGLGIDTWWFAYPGGGNIGRAGTQLMSPITSLDFVLLGLALILLNKRTQPGRWPAQFLCLAAFAAAVFGVLSFIVAPRIAPAYISLSVPTAVTFIVLSFGVVCARTEWGLGAVIASQDLGGILLRRLAPAAICIPVLIGFVRWKISTVGLLSEWGGALLTALLSMALLAGLIAWAAVIVDRYEVDRRKMEEALHASKEELDRLLGRFDETLTEAALRRKVTIGFIVAVLLTIFIGLSSWRGARRAEQDDYWVSHTHEVMEAIQRTTRHLIETGTSARAFALTGQEPLLEHYQIARTSLLQDEDVLRHLTADNRSQQRKLEALEPQICAALDFAELVIAKRRQSGAYPGGSDALETERLSDAVRAITREMYAEETRLLVQRTERAHAGQSFTKVTAVVGALLGVGLWVLAELAVNREIGVSSRAQGQLSILNAELEERVEQRTAALQAEIAERKRASEGRERLAAIVESSDDAIISKDMNGTINAWNRGAEKIFGYTAAEAVGRPMLILFPPDLVSEEPGILSRIARGESVEHYETVRVRKDGRKIDVSVTISPILDTAGAVVGASQVARDITERIRAQEALRQSDLRRGFALDTAEIGDWDLDLITLQATRSALHDRIFGYAEPLPEWNFEIFLRHVHPEDRERVRETFQRNVRQKKKSEFECRIVHPNGDIRWIWTCGDQLRDTSGKAIRMFGIVQDITERKRSEEVLREQAQVLDLAQVLVRDMQGRIVLWNRGAENLYGFSRVEAVGSVSHELLGTEFPEPLSQIDEKLRRSGFWEGELAHRKRDGTRIVVSSLWVVHRDAQGNPLRVLEANVDITARKQAEQALRDSEERFQAMANGIPQLAWMAEPDGNIFWYNQRWYDYTGTTPEQMKGWGWERVHDPEVLPNVLERWASAIATGEPFEMEFPLRSASGTFRAFLTRVMPVRNAEGQVTRWFGTNTDISEQHRTAERLADQAEELSLQAAELARTADALEAQSAMLKLILESVGEGLIAADREGRFIIWNDSAKKLMGRDSASLPSDQWTQYYKVFLPDGVTPFPPESLPLVRALRGESVQVELMVEQPGHADGVFLEVMARPMKDAEGSLCGGVAVLRDITEHKRAAAALARQAEELVRSQQSLESQTLMLQSVLDSISEGLVAADETGKFILWNPAAAKILGIGLGATYLPSQEWRAHYGLFLEDTVTPFPADQLPLVRAVRGETSTTRMFVRDPELDHGVWIEVTGGPLKDKNGVLRGGVVAFRDITQRRVDEQEIRKLNEELEERVVERTAQLEAANHELEAFTYSVSHDLRAPLRHIGGFSKILSEDFGAELPEEARGHVRRIEDGVHRMGLLVDELLNLARVGRHAVRLQETQLNPIIEEVVCLLQPETVGRAVTWKIEQLPPAQCDPVLIKQVFQNLIANALKFSRTRERAVIEISQREQNGELVIAVRDNGVGFNMKFTDKLFGVFQRLHRAEDFEGTGIGLATVKRIVQKHGGRVWAESELDKGATFFFTLATAKSSSEATSPMNQKSQEPEHAAGEGGKSAASGA